MKTASEIEALVLARLGRGEAPLGILVGCARARRASVLAVVHRLADEGAIERSPGPHGTWALTGVASVAQEAAGTSLERAGTPRPLRLDARLLAAGFGAGAACAA